MGSGSLVDSGATVAVWDGAVAWVAVGEAAGGAVGENRVTEGTGEWAKSAFLAGGLQDTRSSQKKASKYQRWTVMDLPRVTLSGRLRGLQV